MPKALILDAENRSALAATRSLGLIEDLRVYVASESLNDLAHHSKYCDQSLVYPSPSQDQDAFLDWLSRTISNEAIDIVFPMTEITCNILAPFEKQIEGARIPIAQADQIKMLSDKANLMQLAEKVCVPFPKTVYFDNWQQFQKSQDKFEYPYVIKPTFSRYLSHGNWESTSVSIIRNQPDRENCLEKHVYLHDQPFMVQQYIEGEGQGIFALYDQGRAISWFAHKRLQEKPPWGGVSVLSESIAVPMKMKQYAETLLNEANWHGVAMVEFKVSQDGTPYLMEINTRFWGSLQLAIDSGVDFPAQLYRISTGQTIKYSSEEYQVGQRLRWSLGGLDSLFINLKQPYRCPEKSRLKALLRFLVSFFPNSRGEVLRASDPKPGFHELRQYFRQLLGINN